MGSSCIHKRKHENLQENTIVEEIQKERSGTKGKVDVKIQNLIESIVKLNPLITLKEIKKN